MEQKCFLNPILKSECGTDRGKSDIVSLISCNDDVSGHLSGCHLSNDKLNEHELILARAGLFHADTEKIQLLKVCPKHRHSMGKFWRPARTCAYPIHAGKATRKVQVKGTHVIRLQNAQDIQRLYGKTVPIGSRKWFLKYLGHVIIFGITCS